MKAAEKEKMEKLAEVSPNLNPHRIRTHTLTCIRIRTLTLALASP